MTKITKFITLFITSLIGLTLLSTALAGPAEDAFKRKDYNEAYRQWSKNPDTTAAKFGIGQILLEGLDGPKDTEKGLTAIKSAAAKGYTPAVQYLADYSAKAGNYSEAIEYLEQLQQGRATANRQAAIVSYLGRITRQPHSNNSRYCSEITQLDKLGGSTPKRTMSECAINGFESTISKAEATQELQSVLSSAPTYSTLGKLLSQMLAVDAPSFDPELVLTSIEALDSTLNDAQTRILVSTDAVSKDTCTNLPTGSKEQRLKQLAYCSLVAIKGDTDVAALSAKAYLSGELGSPEAERALRFAALARPSPAMDNLRLKAMEATGDWGNHLPLLEKTLSTSSIEENRILSAVKFQTSFVKRAGAGYSRTNFYKLARLALNPKVPLAAAYEILKARDDLPLPTGFSELGQDIALFEETIKQLSQRFVGNEGWRFKVERATSDKDAVLLTSAVFALASTDNPLSRAETLDAVQSITNFASSNQRVLTTEVATQLGSIYLNIGATEKETNADETTRKALGYKVLDALELAKRKSTGGDQSTNAAINDLIARIEGVATGLIAAPQPATPDALPDTNTLPSPPSSTGIEEQVLSDLSPIDKLKTRCEITREAKACLDVGFQLMQRIELESFLNKNDTQEQALKFLSIAAAASETQAYRYIWDIASSGTFQSEADKKTANDALQALRAKRDVGGELRTHLQTIRTNPLNQLLEGVGSILTGNNKILSACNAVRRLVGEGRVDNDYYEKGLAMAALEGNVCKPRSN